MHSPQGSASPEWLKFRKVHYVAFASRHPRKTPSSTQLNLRKGRLYFYGLES